MPQSGLVKWNGDQIVKQIDRRVVKAIDAKLSEAVISAKKNHPGWKNRTGTAEGSVRVVQWARVKGNVIFGSWGSVGVKYVLSLELYRGSFLRRAAARVYGHGKRVRLFS